MNATSITYNQGSPYENLIMRIVHPKNPELKEFYLYSDYTPKNNAILIGPKSLGVYERTLLGKMLVNILPAVCVTGDMGSGKTTTLRHLIRYYLNSHIILPPKQNKSGHEVKRIRRSILLGLIDFKSKERKYSNTEKLLSEIIDEMRAKISFLIDEEHELIKYWDILVEKYLNNEIEVLDVGRKIVSSLSNSSNKGQEIIKRKEILEELKKDQDYYFCYLILLWRFLTDKKIQIKILNDPAKYRISNSLIIIDNLDSLSESAQRWMYDLIISSVNQTGPTFVLFLRPETLERLGKADDVFDHVGHSYIDPFTIIIDRLIKFQKKPINYFKFEKLLTEEEKKNAKEYIDRLLPELGESTGAFHEFLSAATGNSIRLGNLLSQGILLVTPSETKRLDLSPHFIIRLCMKQGREVFQYSLNSSIENPFLVLNSDNSNILLKPRILRYLYHSNSMINLEEVKKIEEKQLLYRKHSRLLNKLRNDFICFGYLPLVIQEALFQMSRDRCQLVFSSGYDIKETIWGDESEIVYLTKIGVGYETKLIHNPDFIQEVMIEIIKHIPGIQIPSGDRLSEKMEAVWRFLRYIREKEQTDMKLILSKFDSPNWFIDNFGDTLITTEIIQKIYPNIGKILQYSASRFPTSRKKYQEILSNFENELRLSEKTTKDMLGTDIVPVDTFSLV